MTAGPVAIVDIGSNSVRLVVYSGATRAPFVLFNEKVMAGLGRDMGVSGTLSDEAQARALSALARFRLLIGRMKVARTRIFATAAVRDAANAAPFVAEIRALGFDPEILSGEEEGRLAALGVLSGIPDADGVVGDLGGGSLELADVADGKVRRRISLPLGVLRIAEMPTMSKAALFAKLRRALEKADFGGLAAGRPFYMVGGSWRALAQLDLELTKHPLPITHLHALAPDRPAALQRKLNTLLRKEGPGSRIGGNRGPTLPHALLLLRAVVDVLAPSRLVASAYGIREGLLYDDLDEATRRIDPLIAGTCEAGEKLGRFPQHGDLIDGWIGRIFHDDAPEAARLRRAACHLADVAWAAHPDFRAERGIAFGLHANWVAIDAAGRALLAQALYTSFGGSGELPLPGVVALCSPEAIKRARHWGLALRLAQRLSAGVAAPLERSSLSIQDDRLVLWLPEGEAAGFGETVERRLRSLANALEKKADFIFG